MAMVTVTILPLLDAAEATYEEMEGTSERVRLQFEHADRYGHRQ